MQVARPVRRADRRNSPIERSKERSGPTLLVTKPPDVKSMFLSVSDLPSGWSLDNSPQSSTNGTCYTDPLKQVASNSCAHINFAKDEYLS